jgi:acetylornithine deacetylase
MDKYTEHLNLFTSVYQSHLHELLQLDTTTPMETLKSSQIKTANEYFASLASAVGFETLLISEPEISLEKESELPHRIREVMEEMSEEFFHSQSNLLLRLGEEKPKAETLMLNFHMDTVAPHLPVSCNDGIIRGRGVIDAKGLGLCMLCGVDKALRKYPDLAQHMCILMQSVCGEEGGSMGFYGSKALSHYSGVLNIIAEPTNNKALDQSTTSMTAKIQVDANSSTDDTPQNAVNATVILGAIAYELAKSLDNIVAKIGAKLCIAGIHTGHLHNRVYGQGTLMINMAYRSSSIAAQLKPLLEKAFEDAKQVILQSFENSHFYAETAAKVASTSHLIWTKQSLPVLNNRNDHMEKILNLAGVEREQDASKAFTCDAMWFQQPNAYTVIFGPGDLGDNGAHTEDEHIELAELDAYSERIFSIVEAFYRQVKYKD